MAQRPSAAVNRVDLLGRVAEVALPRLGLNFKAQTFGRLHLWCNVVGSYLLPCTETAGEPPGLPRMPGLWRPQLQPRLASAPGRRLGVDAP